MGGLGEDSSGSMAYYVAGLVLLVVVAGIIFLPVRPDAIVKSNAVMDRVTLPGGEKEWITIIGPDKKHQRHGDVRGKTLTSLPTLEALKKVYALDEAKAVLAQYGLEQHFDITARDPRPKDLDEVNVKTEMKEADHANIAVKLSDDGNSSQSPLERRIRSQHSPRPHRRRRLTESRFEELCRRLDPNRQ